MQGFNAINLLMKCIWSKKLGSAENEVIFGSYMRLCRFIWSRPLQCSKCKCVWRFMFWLPSSSSWGSSWGGRRLAFCVFWSQPLCRFNMYHNPARLRIEGTGIRCAQPTGTSNLLTCWVVRCWREVVSEGWPSIWFLRRASRRGSYRQQSPKRSPWISFWR